MSAIEQRVTALGGSSSAETAGVGPGGEHPESRQGRAQVARSGRIRRAGPSGGRLPRPSTLQIAFRHIELPEGCWEWQAATNGRYAKVHIGRDRHLAHRVLYELFIGPIPTGLTLDHLCRNSRCVNPRHLEPVTREQNIRRGSSSSADPETQCRNGHERTPENTRVSTRPSGRVVHECWICRRAGWRRKKRAA